MTWEEVCDDPSLQDLPYKVELNKWGNIEMSPVKNRRGELCVKIAVLLRGWKPDGHMTISCGIMTSDNVKVADVAWISSARYDAADSPEIVYTDTAPEICVEIISFAYLSEWQMHKGELYLQAGAKEFWLCNELGDMCFFDADGPMERSWLCPGFPLRVEIPE